MIVFLLVTGILLGMISVFQEVSEEHVTRVYDPNWNGIEGSGKNIGDPPAPCGERGGSGGGTPG